MLKIKKKGKHHLLNAETISFFAKGNTKNSKKIIKIEEQNFHIF